MNKEISPIQAPTISFRRNDLKSHRSTQAKTITVPSEPSSYRASVRRMNHLLTSNQTCSPVSRTKRFIDTHGIAKIHAVLKKYHMTNADLCLFNHMIEEEQAGLLGYQAGSSTIRLFQDILSLLVKIVLQIQIKNDFVFTRVPGDLTFIYKRSQDFLNEKAKNIPPTGWDTRPEIREHILSLNMCLYQSYNAPWDLTPRYYLENQTWTQATVREFMKPFFARLGVEGGAVNKLWDRALCFLPHTRGYILQFFDESQNFEYSKQHTYIALSGGEPDPSHCNHEILSDSMTSNFPQVRLVMNNESTLNPFSPLSIKRYDSLTDQQRSEYESNLHLLIKELPFNPEKVKDARQKLLNFWY